MKIQNILFWVCILSTVLLAQTGIQFEPETTSLQTLLERAQLEKKTVMLDLYADWCVWCKKFDQEVFTNPEVLKFSEYFICGKKNGARNEGIDIVKKYRLTGYPCILFLDANGEEIDRVAGFLTATDFLQRLADVYLGVETFMSLKQKVAQNPQHPNFNFKLAAKYSDRGDLKRARELYQKVVDLDPQNTSGRLPQACFQLGSIAFQAQDFDQAEFYFTRIIQNYPDYDASPHVFRLLASVYTTQKKHQQAITLLEQAMHQLPAAVKKDAILYMLSLNYSLVGENQKSLNVLKDIGKGEVDPFLLQTARARSHFRLQEYEKGLALLNAEYLDAKRDPKKVNDLAWICVEEKVKGALPIQWAENAVTRSNRDPLILDTLAELYFLNARYADAIKIEEEALQKVNQPKYQQDFSRKIQIWKDFVTQNAK
ncbi:tetratricopeptide repeat protein [candidate division KSB1 bacterium]|nr:tetratricopeptide repeat protein [candidate division KSB1 bacterium]